ncbi:MAG: DUF2339 domain-containing protein [Bacteroidales bacterium]|jgi:uncharacterized membrane protein|nr:DUF2339 domain-containing protein [Bacteroidales bacterium]
MLFNTFLLLAVLVLCIVVLFTMSRIRRQLSAFEQALWKFGYSLDALKRTAETSVSEDSADVPQPETIAVEPPVDSSEAASSSAVSESACVHVVEEPAIPPESAAKPDDGHHSGLDVAFRRAFTAESLLGKIGIITLVLGVAFFVKFAVDNNWINETGRIIVGLLTGAFITGVAHWLRKKYDVFAAILTGGGFATLYITVALAFREYHVIGQGATFAALTAITVLAVAMSLLYDRKELALFALLGGYAAPLLVSSGNSNHVVLFIFLLLLNAGMNFISLKKRWFSIEAVSFVSTVLFFWGWMLFDFRPQVSNPEALRPVITAFGTLSADALIFGGLFFVQFYLTGLFDHFLQRSKITVFQAAAILVANLSMFLTMYYALRGCTHNMTGLATVALAMFNALVLCLLWRRPNVDRSLQWLLLGIVVSFVSLAAPVQLNGHIITMFWAAEAVILLLLNRKTGIRLFFWGFLTVSALMLAAYIGNIYSDYNYELTLFINRRLVTGVIVLASLILSCWLLRRRQDVYSVRFLPAIALLAWITGYVVPLLEIRLQMLAVNISDPNYDFSPSDNPLTMIRMVSWTMMYLGSVAFFKIRQFAYYKPLLWTLFASIGLFAAVVSPALISFRDDVFLYSMRGVAFFAWKPLHFAAHYLVYPGLILVVFCFVWILKFRRRYWWSAWLLTALVVFILSVELTNTVVQLLSDVGNYERLCIDVRTFGFPILWGFIAMLLMLWGLKRKNAKLRQIALTLFGVTLLLFYVFDVWAMSQTGRVVSFVILGIILLAASFMMQKIKGLMK